MSSSNGGAEILKYQNAEMPDVGTFNDYILYIYNSTWAIKILIIALLVLTCVVILLRIFRVRYINIPKGVATELDNIADIRSRDKSILRKKKLLNRITSIVKKSPFRLDEISRDHYQYNINRAGLLAPGDSRYLSSDEYRAIIITSCTGVLVASILIGIGANIGLGVILCVGTILFFLSIPDLMLRSKVSAHDAEIKTHFPNFYLMLHYNLVSETKTEPLERKMLTYSKTTDSIEMLRFVDTCVHLIETHGEYKATKLISDEYKEIAEVTKLMRLIRQQHEKANIATELEGFKREVINYRKAQLEKRKQRIVKMAQASFIVIQIILGQAMLSAIAVYLPDLAIAQSLFGP